MFPTLFPDNWELILQNEKFLASGSISKNGLELYLTVEKSKL